jgi:acyl-CoA thioesterase FadM
MEFSYQIKNQDNKLIITAKTVAVCVDKHFKPKSIPEEIKQALLQTIAK